MRRRMVLISAMATAAVLGIGTPAAPDTDRAGERFPASREFSVQVLSGPADMVTGGEALVEVVVPRSVPVHQVGIALNGADVRGVFRAAEGDQRRLIGRVDALHPGSNRLTATANGDGLGRPAAELELVNHPGHGPVFSGPQVRMYCTADEPPWNLGAVDEHCHVDQATVTYRYRTTSGEFRDLPADDGLPGDVAITTTTEGDEVPYVVRVERGTINRAVYETAILHEPGTPLPDAWTPTPGWNGVLVYTFGGACGTGHWQGRTTGGVEQDLLLRQGYAVASSSLNVYATNCDDVTSAESAMMVKEHFIETYGPDRFTIGWGGSAGTMQQLLISNAYPGILDGVVGEIGYPDERTVTVNGHDCRALTGYWNETSTSWTAEERRAVTGYATPNACTGFMFFDGVDYPDRGCADAIPVADRWDPETNPSGIRCTISDLVANVYGRDDNGYGRRVAPDNVGVQYGLQPLNDGVISVDQFLEMNEAIGGFDVDGVPTQERSAADPAALERAYATGRVNEFSGGLEFTPIIEVRPYRDLQGDFHDRYRSWMMRERMLTAQGNAHTHISWTGPGGGAVPEQMRSEALAAMHDWLRIRSDLAERRPLMGERDLTVRSRPAGLSDGCFTDDGAKIDEQIQYGVANTCNELYPYHADPRVMAGAPLAGDVLKCSLTRPSRDDYAVTFTDAQWERLVGIFPDGVCDWDQPGVGQVPLEGVWLTFSGR
ncbi:DUF6351 family protein [Phytoactinopolyspora halotolerans]|uniref:DUF6351 domain-containing protein n=1 Tax=Phytoactinopolyspora halotolerans TaxID=1981512 RepID=A0A6L9S238_9ACTN|nr:DUF6351 family protein [Phytoactinopolyspora halotolerans]NED99078.1 hypothetical protein [Phytoactinopolyspora halotolerans]